MRALPTAPGPGHLFDVILPEGPVARELRGRGDPDCLLPEEARVVASAVVARQREFAAGRACAREALAGLGLETGPILPGPGREPTWPSSAVGSITHCDGLAAAVVAPARDWLALGIDAEPAEPLPREVSHRVVSTSERSALAGLPDTRVPWDRVIFSAKESLYKVWFPHRRQWLGFDDAAVHLRGDGRFSARILRREIGRMPREVHGQWAVVDGFVATAIAIPRGAPGATGR